MGVLQQTQTHRLITYVHEFIEVDDLKIKNKVYLVMMMVATKEQGTNSIFTKFNCSKETINPGIDYNIN